MATPSSQLPPNLAALVDHPRPDSAVWAALCQVVAATTLPPATLATLKRALNTRWPEEVPRKAPREWLTAPPSLAETFRPLIALCRDVREVDTYPLYIDAAAQSPLLRCRNGSPAVTLWRQPRGVVTLESGVKMKLGEDGMADLGGSMVVEWERHSGGGPEQLLIGVWHRTELYPEVEVKLDGAVPPSAPEYRGPPSKRKPTPTEQDQLTRQRARTSRGGCYIFAERVAEAVAALVEYRQRVVSRLQ